MSIHIAVFSNVRSTTPCTSWVLNQKFKAVEKCYKGQELRGNMKKIQEELETLYSLDRQTESSKADFSVSYKGFCRASGMTHFFIFFSLKKMNQGRSENSPCTLTFSCTRASQVHRQYPPAVGGRAVEKVWGKAWPFRAFSS